jgi:cell wall assembly regulator SMI1
MRDSWGRLVAGLGTNPVRLRLRAGLDEARIVAAEAGLGFRLPEDYREWLQMCDGQEFDDVDGLAGLSLFPDGGAWLHPLERVMKQWRWERGFDLDDYDAIPQTQDRERIRFFVGHPRRVTIAGPANLDGGNVLLDLVPGPHGAPGQLIGATSECDFEVLGASLSAYVNRLAALLEGGELVVVTDESGYEKLVMPGGGDVWRLVRGERQRR